MPDHRTELDDLIETGSNDELLRKLHTFRQIRRVFLEQNPDTERGCIKSITRVIDRLSEVVRRPPNSLWMITPGWQSPEEYRGRKFIYTSEDQAREDAERILGTVSLVELVGDGDMPSTTS